MKRICHIYMLWVLTNEIYFSKIISQLEFDHGLFTKLPILFLAHEFTLKGSIATWRLFITRRFSCELNSSRTYFLRNISCRCNFNPTRNRSYTARKIKFSIKDFFSIFGQIRRKLWIWSYLLKKSLMQNLIFFAVLVRTVLTVSHP